MHVKCRQRNGGHFVSAVRWFHFQLTRFGGIVMKSYRVSLFFLDDILFSLVPPLWQSRRHTSSKNSHKEIRFVVFMGTCHVSLESGYYRGYWCSSKHSVCGVYYGLQVQKNHCYVKLAARDSATMGHMPSAWWPLPELLYDGTLACN